MFDPSRIIINTFSGRRVSRDHPLLTGKRSHEIRKYLNFAATNQIANAFSNASRASR